MSGIYICGAEMPRKKKTTLTIFPDGRVYENHGERLWGHGEDCIPWKAVPVPDHGDLIDRREILKDWEEPHPLDYNGNTNRSRVVNAPTVIPADKEERR